MATITLGCKDTQVIRRPAAGTYAWRWTMNHSVDSKNGRVYHGNTYDTGGAYNGNMATYMWFNDMRAQIMGVRDRITNITIHLYCQHCYSSSGSVVKLNTTEYWDAGCLNAWVCGNGGDDYGTLHLSDRGDYWARPGQWLSIDITYLKDDIADDRVRGFAMYTAGAYNVSSRYAYFGGDWDGPSPYITVEYNPNRPPNTPPIQDLRTTVNGWGSPDLSFFVINAGDPDGNIQAWSAEILDPNDGHRLSGYDWYGSNLFNFTVPESYRGSYLNVRGWARDTYGETAYSTKAFWINRRPYWTGKKEIYFSTVKNNVFKDILTFTWDQAVDDDAGQNVVYNVFYKKTGDTGWTLMTTGLTSPSYSINLGASMADGEAVQIMIAATDGVEEPNDPQNLISEWIYKDVPPSAPANITPNSGHFEKNISLKWTAVDPILDGVVIDKYIITMLAENGTTITTFTSTTNSLNVTTLDTLVVRGAKFKFQIVAVDNLGNNSSPGVSGLLSRNIAPRAPLTFKTKGTLLHFQDIVPLTWVAGTDADSDPLTYKIWLQVNGGAWTLLAENINTLEYNHNISAYPPKTKLNYKIKSVDSFGVESDNETFIAFYGQLIVNTPPVKPTLIYPITGKSIYNKKPRLAFKINNDDDKDLQVLYVTVNGTTYNSKDNAAMFAYTSSSSNTTTMFVPNVDFAIGVNTVSFYTHDGLVKSDTTTVNITVLVPTVTGIGSTENRYIKADDINKLRDMINTTRDAYGLTAKTFTNSPVVSNVTYVKSTHYNEMLEGIFDANKILNDWTPVATVRRPYTMPNIAPLTVITSKTHFNQILQMLLDT